MIIISKKLTKLIITIRVTAWLWHMMQMSAAFFPTRLKMATCNIIFYLTENYPDAQAKSAKEPTTTA